MNIDEQIEQLSFGRSLPRMSSCLGMFLSPTAIFLAEVSLTGAKPKVLHLVRLPIPGADDSQMTKGIGSLNTEFLADQEKLQALLKKAITDVKWGSKFLMVSLSHHFGILRYFAMPAIDRRFWKTAVPAEAKKYVPIPFATLSHDFLVHDLEPGADRRPRMGALFSVTQKQNLENLKVLTEAVGLQLVGVELAPCSVERLWDRLDIAAAGSPYAQVHFDGGHIRILISDQGLPIFFREIFLPQDATVMDRRKVDLAGCINFTKKQIGSQPPEKVRLSGRIGDMGAWLQAFSQDLSRKVEYQDTDKELGLKGGQWGAYAAVGTAVRHLGTTPLTLDLSASGKISDEDRQAAKTILLLSAMVAAVFLVIGSFRFMMYAVKAREFNAMKSQGAILQEFEGKTANDIQYLMSNMKKGAQEFGSLTATRLPLTNIAEKIAELIPEAAWISDFNYTNPVSMGGAGGKNTVQPRTLNLTGNVIEHSVSMEQDIAYSFAKRLQEDKDFSKAFQSISIEVSRPQLSEAPNKSKAVRNEEQNIKNQLKRASRFTIECLSMKRK
ncbi:MAG: hypothetical protein ABIJ96_12445 [Elusimicrobiota bacterium]